MKKQFDPVGNAIQKEKNLRSGISFLMLVVFSSTIILLTLFYGWKLPLLIWAMIMSYQVMVMQTYIFTPRYPKEDKPIDREPGKPTR